MRISNDIIFTNAAMTGTSVVNSPAIWLGHISLLGLHIYWTKSSGTLAGTFKVQVSNDSDPNASGQSLPNDPIITNWTDLPSATLSATDANGSGVISLQNIPFKWARVVYTNATGVGVANGRFNAKGI
jgi:hypothetical protein